MLKNKKDMITIVAFVTITFVAIIIKSNTLEKESTVEGTAMVPIEESEKIVYQEPDLNPQIIEQDSMLDEPQNTLLPMAPNRMTFGEAFSKARLENGPGSLFKWNGKTFTASYAEELVEQKDNIVDSAKVNIVLNQVNPKEN